MHDIEIRGSAILEITRLAPQSLETWREYFSTVLSGVVRIRISIAAVRTLTSLLKRNCR
jgi:hypothetical protein